MTDKEGIKNHPAFLAYRGSNIKPVDKVDTQLNDADKDNMGATGVANDKYTEKKDGEGGKA